MKRLLCTFALLMSCTAAFAQERLTLGHTLRQQPPAGEALRSGENALPTGQEQYLTPMLYALPAVANLGRTGGAVLQVRISNAGRTMVRQTVALPASVPQNATINVLFGHSKELQRLRALDKSKPGTLRFVASIGDRVLTDASFADIDEYGSSLSASSAVGTMREVEVKMLDPKRLRTADKDPSCLESCDLAYQDCYARCDERGDSCARCSDEYNDCYYYCPDVCTEPKSVSYSTVWTVNNWAWYGTSSCLSYWYPQNTGSKVWDEVYVWYTVTTYQHTEHCDSSYTDTQTGQYNTSGWCWAEQNQSCSTPTGSPNSLNSCP